MDFNQLDVLLYTHFGEKQVPLVEPENLISQQPAAQANNVTLGNGIDPSTARGLENIILFPPSRFNPAKPCTMQDWLTDAIKHGQTKEAIADEATQLLTNGRAVYYQQSHARPTKIRLDEDNTHLIESEIGSPEGTKPERLSFIQRILNFFGFLKGADKEEHQRRAGDYNMEKYVHKMQQKRKDQFDSLKKESLERQEMQQQNNNQNQNQNQNQMQNNQMQNNQMQNNQMNNQMQNNQMNNNQMNNNQMNNNQTQNKQNIANQSQPSGYQWKGKGTVVGQSTTAELAAKKLAADALRENQKKAADVLVQQKEATKLTEKLKKNAAALAAARKEKIEFQNKNTKIQELLELTEEEMRRPDNANIRNPQLTEVLKLVAASIIMEAIEPLLDSNSPAYDDKFQALMLTAAFENFTNQGCQNISTSIKNGQFFDKFASHLMEAPTGNDFPMTSRNLNGLQTFCVEPPTMLKQLNAVLNKDLKIDQPKKQIAPQGPQQLRQAELDNAIKGLKHTPETQQHLRQVELNDVIKGLKNTPETQQQLRQAELNDVIKNLKPKPAEKVAEKDPLKKSKNPFMLGL